MCDRTYFGAMDDLVKTLRDELRLLMAAHGALDEHTRPCGTRLSMPHAHALLELLSAEGPLSVTELSAALNIDRTNVSRLCVRMEEQGEVIRSKGDDARVTEVVLTPKGRMLAEGVDGASAHHMASIARSLDRPMEEIIESLRALRFAIQQKDKE